MVDDSKSIRIACRLCLENHGYLVEEAENGVDALEKYPIFKPDLTVMDINMPKMNGLDAIAKINQNYLNQKFILMTSSSREDELMTAKSLQVLHYLIKPVQPINLLEKINNVFS